MIVSNSSVASISSLFMYLLSDVPERPAPAVGYSDWSSVVCRRLQADRLVRSHRSTVSSRVSLPQIGQAGFSCKGSFGTTKTGRRDPPLRLLDPFQCPCRPICPHLVCGRLHRTPEFMPRKSLSYLPWSSSRRS